MDTSQISSSSSYTIRNSQATNVTTITPLMQKETNHSSIFEISVATAGPIAATNVTIDDASHVSIGPLSNNSVYRCYLPIFCGAVACLYITIWIWICHRSWLREHREAKSRLDHWRNHMLFSRVSKRLSRRLNEFRWRQQPALPVWRKDRTDSMYTARRDTFVEKDGKADYSQYATAQYATTTTSVELPAQLSPNPIPYSITRHHKSLNTKNHWHGHRKIHRKAWVSHDLRNITPVTFTSSAQTPVVRGSYDAGTSCSSTPTIIESPESGTKSDPYSVKV
jgi:hypothetical protein